MSANARLINEAQKLSNKQILNIDIEIQEKFQTHIEIWGPNKSESVCKRETDIEITCTIIYTDGTTHIVDFIENSDLFDLIYELAL